VNFQETAQLLTKAALIDNRNITPMVTQAWQEVLAEVPYADAMDALGHHRATSTDYLVPAHITKRVRDVRSQRIAHEQQPMPPAEIADDGKGALGWLRRRIKAIGDGWSVDAPRRPFALPPGQRRQGPPPDAFVEGQAAIRALSSRPERPEPPPALALDLTDYEPARDLLASLNPDTTAALLAQARANLGDDAPTHQIVIHAADLARRPA
jgi:hypothetical protein